MVIKKNIYDDASLMKKSLLQDLNEEEREQLEQLLGDRPLQEIYEQLNDPAYLKKLLVEYENYSSKKGYAVFKERRGHTRREKMIHRFATIAAVGIIVLGITLWMTYGRQDGNTNVLPVASKAIPAGEKRALLTLVDGSTVEVSENNALALQEKGVNIEYKHGEISYEAKKKCTEIAYNELKVPRGGECVIRLDDGTKVWVNAETRLKYPVAFVGERREVILEGEAFFDVAKSEKPFIVKTSFGDVRVLGTAFGVNAYANEPECYTTLVRGKVSVATGKSNPLVIFPGEQVVISKDEKMEKREVDVSEFIGWKDGVYVFREKPLGDIMKTLERWYDISVLFEEESLIHLPFSGNLKRYDDINVFFDALTRTGDLKYRLEGNHVILYK